MRIRLGSHLFVRKAFLPNARRRWQRVQAAIILSLLVVVLASQWVGRKPMAHAKLDDVAVLWLKPIEHAQTVFSNQWAAVHTWLSLSDSNQQLAKENQQLREQLSLSQQAVAENTELRSLLRMPTEGAQTIASARVIGFAGLDAGQELLINAGRQAGTNVGDLAFAPDGLIGRVIEVGALSARVLLLTHPDSRLPVVITPGNTRAILSGDGANPPYLSYVQLQGKLQAGQQVITAGIGEGIPYGLPLGQLGSKMDSDGNPLVALSRQSIGSSFLRIVRYGGDQVYSGLTYQVN
jgi:rod shape-determining protein MreC